MENELESNITKFSSLLKINPESAEEFQTFSEFYEKFEDNTKMQEYQNFIPIFFYFALYYSAHDYKNMKELSEDLRTIIFEKNYNNFNYSPYCFNQILINYLMTVDKLILYYEYDIFENENEIIALHKIIQIIPKLFENEKLNNYIEVVDMLKQINEHLNDKLKKNFADKVKIKIEKYYSQLQKYINNFMYLINNNSNNIINNNLNKEKIKLNENDLMFFKNNDSVNKNYTNNSESINNNILQQINNNSNDKSINKNSINYNNQINNNSIESNPYNMNNNNNNNNDINSYNESNFNDISSINKKSIGVSGSFASNLCDSKFEESKDQIVNNIPSDGYSHEGPEYALGLFNESNNNNLSDNKSKFNNNNIINSNNSNNNLASSNKIYSNNNRNNNAVNNNKICSSNNNSIKFNKEYNNINQSEPPKIIASNSYNIFSNNNINNNNAKKNNNNKSDNVIVNKENKKKKKTTMVDKRQSIYERLEKDIKPTTEDDFDF